MMREQTLPMLLLFSSFVLLTSFRLCECACTSEGGNWILGGSDLTALNNAILAVQDCQKAASITINPSALTLASLSLSVNQVTNDVVVSLGKNGIISGNVSFPNLKSIGGQLTMATTGDFSKLGGAFLPALELVTGVTITGASGPIGHVYLSPSVNPLVIVQDLKLLTTSSVYGNISNVYINGLKSVRDVIASPTASNIGSLYINVLTPEVGLSARDIIFTTGSSTRGGFDDGVIYGIASARTILLDAAASKMGYFTFVGISTNFQVSDSIEIRTSSSVYGGVKDVVIERLSLVGSFLVRPQASDIGTVSVNVLSPGVHLDINSDLLFESAGSTYGSVGDITVRGLRNVYGDFQVQIASGDLGKIFINNASDPCDGLVVAGNMVFSTGSSVYGHAGDIAIVGLQAVSGTSGLSIFTRGGELEDIIINRGKCTSPVFINGPLTVTTGSSVYGNLGHVQLTDIGTISGALQFDVDESDLVSIRIGGSADVPMVVKGDITFRASSSVYGEMFDIVVSDVGSAYGLSFDSNAGNLDNITILGHSAGFALSSGISISGSSSVYGLIKSVLVTNLVSVGGDVTLVSDGGDMIDLVFNGHPTLGLSVVGGFSMAGSTSLYGLVSHIEFTQLISLGGSISIAPKRNKYKEIIFRGAELVVEGGVSIFHNDYNSPFLDAFTMTGLSRIGGSVTATGFLQSAGGLVTLTSSKTTGFVIDGTLDIRCNSEFSISNVSKIGGNINVLVQTTYTEKPVSISGGAVYNLDVFGQVKVSSETVTARVVDISNLRIIRGGSTALVSGLSFLSVYRSTASNKVGPVTINGVLMSGSAYISPYLPSSAANDPVCVNSCNGRGYAPFLQTGGCGSPCVCFPYNNGTKCEFEQVCEALPTCDCKCSSWSAWQAVTVDAAYRNRTCSSGIVCSKVELRGSVVCSGSEYELIPPTASSFRVCKPLSTCNLDYSYQSKAPTATSNRVCSNLTICGTSQFESVPSTPTSNRVCKNFKTCSSSEYIYAQGTGLSDVVCQTCAVCTGGLVLTPCSQYADTECKGCSSCDLTANYIAAECNPNAGVNTVCLPCLKCNYTAQFLVSPCSRNVNTVCQTFANCDFTTQYQSVPGTTSTDRVCKKLLSCSSNPDFEFESVKPSQTSNRVCKSTSSCTSEQYQTVSPTLTSDRICASLTPFDPTTQYMVVENTPTSDRVVASLTSCSFPLKYESQAPTFTTNRVCSSPTVCTDGSLYETLAMTPTSDRHCEALTTCISGYSEYVAPTATSDRVCIKNPTVCSDSQYETHPLTSSTDRKCESLTVCVTGQIEYSAPTLTTNRVCVSDTECTSAQYEKTPGTTTSSRVCSTIKTCNATYQYESAAPTSTTDRTCSDDVTCDYSTQYQSAPLSSTQPSQCTGLSSCPSTSNLYEAFPPTETTDRICGGIQFCDTTLQYEALAYTATSDRVCEFLSWCAAFQFEFGAPSPTTDRLCHNLTACLFPNEFESIPPTSNSDRGCSNTTVCSSNQYQLYDVTPTTDRVCVPHSAKCGSNYYEYRPTTATSDRKCQKVRTCSNSQYESVPPTATTDAVCKSLTYCTYYQKESVAPTPTTDRVCVNDFCAKGKPCAHGGNCTNVGKSSYVCSCLLPYYGDYCTSKYPKCLPNQDLCFNGGSCYVKPDQNIFCDCPQGYGGELCLNDTYTSNSGSSSPSSSSSSQVMGSAIGAGVGVIVLIAVIVLLTMRRKNKLRPALSSNSSAVAFENKAFDSDGFDGNYYDSNYYLNPQRDGSSVNYEQVSQNTLNRSVDSGSNFYNSINRQGDLGNYDVADPGPNLAPGLYDTPDPAPTTQGPGLYDTPDPAPTNQAPGLYDTPDPAPSNISNRVGESSSDEACQGFRAHGGDEQLDGYYDNVMGGDVVAGAGDGYLDVHDDE